MKANVKKIIDQLKPSEKKKLDEMIFERLDEELCIAQFNWIKMGCCSLADIPTIKVEEMLMWIGGFMRLYRQNARFKTQEELSAFLDKRMNEIFGEDGFPEEFMQSFKEIGR